MHPLIRPKPLVDIDDIKPTITYSEWCETYGKYRWYHQDGTPRTYHPLDYEWKAVYDIVTANADLYFNNRIIEMPSTFSAEFLANVPQNWLKFKTEMELYTGSLSGTTIDPDLFNQGYTRDLTSQTTDNGTSTASSTTTTDSTDVIGSRSDTSTTHATEDINAKARSINYEQGVQAYDDILNNDNIGELGNDYASNFTDSVQTQENVKDSTTDSTQGKQTNTSDVNGTNNSRGTTNNVNDVILHEKVERINFYDNLAFLRDRMDRLGAFQSFCELFEPYFARVHGFVGAWM